VLHRFALGLFSLPEGVNFALKDKDSSSTYIEHEVEGLLPHYSMLPLQPRNRRVFEMGRLGENQVLELSLPESHELAHV